MPMGQPGLWRGGGMSASCTSCVRAAWRTGWASPSATTVPHWSAVCLGCCACSASRPGWTSPSVRARESCTSDACTARERRRTAIGACCMAPQGRSRRRRSVGSLSTATPTRPHTARQWTVVLGVVPPILCRPAPAVIPQLGRERSAARRPRQRTRRVRACSAAVWWCRSQMSSRRTCRRPRACPPSTWSRLGSTVSAPSLWLCRSRGVLLWSIH